MNSLNSVVSILSKRGTDDQPPHPVEPYGSRQLLPSKTQGIFHTYLIRYSQNLAGIHGTDELLAGKPHPPGPKKPIRPWPFDPYGSKKLSMAHRRQPPASACAIDGKDHEASTKTWQVGMIASTLAQLLHDHITANKSTTV